MKLEVKMGGLAGVIETLKRLPPEVVSKKGGPVLAALRKGARLLVKQSRDNFRAAVAMPGRTGITDTTGFTEKQIVSKRRLPPSGTKGERIIVTVNPKVHPSGQSYKRKSRAGLGKRLRKGNKGPSARPVQANDIAFMMEYGTRKQEATPWLRPAYEAKREEVLHTIETDLTQRVNRIVKKLVAQTKGK